MPKWVLSNDLQISWVGDHCRIFNQRRPDLSIMSTDWSICLLLDLFKYPSDPESVLESCHSISTEKARDFIRELAAIEVLVPESCIPKHAPDGAGQAQQYEQSLHTRRQRLQFLKYDDLGLTITNCGKNELSRGCQACKSGSSGFDPDLLHHRDHRQYFGSSYLHQSISWKPGRVPGHRDSTFDGSRRRRHHRDIRT